MPLRQGRKSASQTPTPKSERIYGSEKNPKGSASSSKSAKNITFSDKTIKALQNKLDEFKEKHKGKKNITLGDLKAVYRRGSGAYSSSHRPGISRNGWAMARVNKFLLKAGGTKVKAAYVQDDDLMKHEDGGKIESGVDLMKMHLGGDMSKHLAPNGKPSNLTHEQWHLVRTPEFKAWFGDWENNPEKASKVVDDNGEPLVLIRGNLINQEELGYTFNLGQNFLKKESGNTFGFFFTNNIDIAKKYMLVDHFDEIRGGSITNVFIKSNKILDLKDFDLKIGQHSFVQRLIEKGISFDEYKNLEKRILDFDSDTYKYWGNNIFDYFDVFPELRNLFIKNGFSSVIFYEMSRSYIKYEVYVAFDSNQIKLADGTNTTFDGGNPDIRYAKGGKFNDKELLAKYKRGESIGFTGIAHLKAKGLIPRVDGTKRKSKKYKNEGGEIPNDLRELPYYKGAYRGAELHSLQDDVKYQKMADRWYDLMQKHQSGKKLDKKEFEEFEKLSSDLYRSDEYFEGGEIDEIVYHGSPNKFEKFELEKVGTTTGRLTGGYGIYFTNKEEVAKEYALKGGSFIQAKLKVSNFFDLDENITDVDKILEQVEKDERFTENDVDNLKSDFLGMSDYGYEVATNRQLHEWLSDTLDEQQVSEFIEKLGYDGTTFVDKWDKDARNYVIFNPNDVEIVDIEKLAKGKKLKSSGGGDCYYIAGQFAMDNIFSPKKIDYIGTPYLVHAEVQGQGHIAHIRYGHAWVEDDENVYDFSNGRELVIPKPLYYAIGDIRTNNPKKYQKYTFAEARQKMLQTKHYGCWDIDVEYKDGGEVITDDEKDLYDIMKYQKLQKSFKDGGLIAPNGKKSNLTHEQWHLVRTPEFKAWFGDFENNPKEASKVVDENGEPLLVYHGTDRKFTSFNKRLIGSSSGEENERNGFYFTSNYDTAKYYADYYDEQQNYVMTCFLNLRNPIIKNKETPLGIFTLIENAFENDNDGVIIESVTDSRKTSDQIIAFEPNQIKLADGINTTFDGGNPDIRYAEGGDINQEVTCINCGWQWNTKDSEEFDKYVCHKCGFDNTLYYSDLNDDIMSKLKKPKTLSEIAEIHKVSEEVLAQQLQKGIEAEMEHTTDQKIAETIALHHLEEMPDYYDRLKEMESNSNIIKNEYKQNEMKKVRFVGDDRAFWYVISETPEYYIGVIDEKLENWQNADQKTKVQYFEDYLPKEDVEIFEKTTDQLKEGGVVVGKRHSESDENGTGERFLVKSTGQVVELEGGEGVLNKESMTSNKTYEFQGKKMSARQIASFLNHKYGGVEFAEGGDVKSVCGCKSYYHGGELPSATLDSLEGGEAVVTVKTMESKDKYQFQGVKMTPRKILSQINADFGGKKFDEGGTIDISDYKLQNEIKLANMYQFVQKLLYHKRNIM